MQAVRLLVGKENTMSTFIVKTERLDLIPLSDIQLRQYLERPSLLEQELGIQTSRNVVTENVQRAINMKLSKMALAKKGHFGWYTYWLLAIRSLRFGAGLVGFKGFPDQNGEVEIGYGIDPDCQRKGYMTEAVQAMITWAFEEPSCYFITARKVKKWNLASQRILFKVGMRIYEESDDGFSFRLERDSTGQLR